MSSPKQLSSDMYYKPGYIAPVFCGADSINSPPTPRCWPNISCSTTGVALCKFPNTQYQARLFYPRHKQASIKSVQSPCSFIKQ